MNTYIRIMRLDHWIKQLFIIPGILFAVILLDLNLSREIFNNFILAFLSTSCIASANYIINEWLDAEFDKFHPTKKYRSIVTNGANKNIIYTLYSIVSIIGIIIACIVSKYLVFSELFLLVMGIVYNVKPVRSKDIAFLDVLSESINNAIRFLIGWFTVTSVYYPPISIIIGYWLAGSFLMAMKRFSEYRMINDKELAGRYRKSFAYYTEKTLLISSFFYAILSVFFIGIFLIKYKIELILFVPFFVGVFCIYLYIAFKEDSSAQKPEKLFKEKYLIVYIVFITIIFFITLNLNIDCLSIFKSSSLYKI